MSELAKSLAVIVPAYNAGRYLEDLINSIYGGDTCLGPHTGQTLLPEEVIICDDCSTDNTAEIIQNLHNSNSRIRYCKTPTNSGTSAACNVAIRHTDCKFITRIDADDMREAFSYEVMYPLLLKNSHSMIYDDITLFSNRERRRTWGLEEYDLDRILEYNYIHCGVMYTRKAWEDAKGYRERFNNGRDDWAFNVALGLAGYPGIHIKKPGYLYRRDQQNRSIKNGTSEWQLQFCEKMEKEFGDEYQKRGKMCCGNRRGTSTQTPDVQKAALVGSEGMAILVYNGANVGTETFFGPVTGSPYRFSSISGKNKRLVDVKDLHTDRNTGLLDLVEFGKPIFSRLQ